MIVANHPLGALDSFALIKLVSRVRKDIKIVANDFLKEPTRKLNTLNYIYPVVKIGIKVIRFCMGKENVNEKELDHDNKELEVAYFYERNRRYEKSKEIYKSKRKRNE